VDGDGKVRLILCHRDPGYHNWLDTQGFERGNLTYRNLLGTNSTTFRTQVLKTSALVNALPSDSATVSLDERVTQMKARCDSIRRRYRQ
jgi:hypothetical protein